MSEADRIAKVRALFGAAHVGVPLAIGDDCAVLAPGPEPLVWTIDAQIEGVHFARDLMTLEDVGWRSFMAAASDLAAMAARPVAALSALALPADLPEADLDALLAGQLAASRAIGLPVVGGNFTRAREIGITTTAIGAAARPVTRQGARAGDRVLVAGALGLARAGLEAARRGGSADDLTAALEAYRRPRARIDDGLAAAGARAMIDVSDGLALDVARLGVGVELDEGALVAASGPLPAIAGRLGLDPIACILHGGDDYALIAASDAPIPGFSPIGRVLDEPGVWLVRAGERTPITPGGWDHFA